MHALEQLPVWAQGKLDFAEFATLAFALKKNGVEMGLPRCATSLCLLPIRTNALRSVPGTSTSSSTR